MSDGQKKQGAAILLVYGHELMLLLRDDKPELNAALQWTVLAGGMETGESADQAIDREIREEIGTMVSELTCIGSTTSNTWYTGVLNGQQVANIRQGEGCAHGFFSFDALVALAKVEGKGGLGGAITKFVRNAPSEIKNFLDHYTKPNLELMMGASASAAQ
jgi:8-oxo-dGTP pyrophosphatase MutT (NUDIX family)